MAHTTRSDYVGAGNIDESARSRIGKRDADTERDRRREAASMKSIPTRGRTLDYAAALYDVLEPLMLAGKKAKYDTHIVDLLDPGLSDRVLDLGCGTGVLCDMIGRRLDPSSGGVITGIDAAAGMIRVAKKRREGAACRFRAMAAEDLDFPDRSFDGVVSSLFFHHVPLDLKERALREAYRVLKPGGKLVIADMHIPTTLLGSCVSRASRWFFLQPQIAENIRGVLPSLIRSAGFENPAHVATYLGYIALFRSVKP
jgi:ubiquinone/menaquinone biosynthesis C-methylase UbiE